MDTEILKKMHVTMENERKEKGKILGRDKMDKELTTKYQFRDLKEMAMDEDFSRKEIYFKADTIEKDLWDILEKAKYISETNDNHKRTLDYVFENVGFTTDGEV